jgi:serine/threonine protein phosphatase PrpC
MVRKTAAGSKGHLPRVEAFINIEAFSKCRSVKRIFGNNAVAVMAELQETPQIFIDQRMEDCFLSKLGHGEAAVFSSRAPEKTSENEDAAGLFPCGSDSCVLAVADGVGGGRDGAAASRLTLAAMKSAIDSAVNAGESLRTGILNGFEDANRSVLKLGGGAATTLAVAEIEKNRIRSYHVGDSFVLVVGQRGRVKLQTVSHSPTGYGLEAGLLDERDALFHEERHIISNFIGSPEMRIEIGSALALAARDTVLLASDGLSDNLRSKETIDLIRKGSLKSSADQIAHRCGNRMTNEQNGSPSKPDDLTFILFRLNR